MDEMKRLSGALQVFGLTIEEQAYYESGVRPAEHRTGDSRDGVPLLVCRWAGVNHTFWGYGLASCESQAVELVRQGAFVRVELAAQAVRTAQEEEERERARYQRLLALIDGGKEES